MQQVLADRISKYLCLDDVIAFSKSLNDHMKHLRAVFNQLRKAGLMLNTSKCKLLCSEVKYLVTKDVLKPNNCNFDAVKKFLRSANLKQLLWD